MAKKTAKKSAKKSSSPAVKVVEVFPSMRAAAAALGLDVEQLKDAKNRGCPAFDAANRVRRSVLLQWMESDREERAKRRQDESEDDAEDDIDYAEGSGVGGTLKRLEQYESLKRKELQQARKNGLPLEKIEKQWLAVCRELLRFEATVEANKRESGELITRESAIAGVRALLAWHCVGTSDAIRNFIPSCEMRSKTQIARVIDPALRAAIYRSLDAGVKIGRIPDWMAEAAKSEIQSAESIDA